VGACEFPSTVSLSSCTGTLVHPEVVLYAAHCGSSYGSVFFGDDTSGAGFSVDTEFCDTHPSFGGIGNGTDFAFCKLSEPVTSVPPTPPLMGCEVDVLTEGREVWIVGFGQNDDGGYGRKYKALVQFNYFDSVGDANVGGNGTTICYGDSGGPAFVQLPAEMGFDGSWRAFGIASYIYTPCGNEGFHAVMHRGIDWIEDASGVDVTPCHDADGTWNPGPECKDFPLATDTGSGSWDSACDPGPLSSWSSNCGPSYAETNDQVAPRVTFVSPSDGEFLPGDPVTGKADVRVELTAEDDESAVASVQLLVDGSAVGEPDVASPWVFELKLGEGDHELSAIALDEADNEGQGGPIAHPLGRDAPPAAESSGEDGGSDPPEDDDQGDGGDGTGGSGLPSALPATYGMGGAPGCSCTTTPASAPLWLLLLLFISRSVRTCTRSPRSRAARPRPRPSCTQPRARATSTSTASDTSA
jgi:MYXO-CTERM domain-containing protein